MTVNLLNFLFLGIFVIGRVESCHKKRSFTNQLDDYIHASINSGLGSVYDQTYIRTGETRITDDPPNTLSDAAFASTIDKPTLTCDRWFELGGRATYYFIAKGRCRKVLN